jgi:hypothetical protein
MIPMLIQLMENDDTIYVNPAHVREASVQCREGEREDTDIWYVSFSLTDGRFHTYRVDSKVAGLAAIASFNERIRAAVGPSSRPVDRAHDVPFE